MTQSFEAYIFDMDGTLVDSEVVWETVEVQMFADRGLEYTDAVRQTVIGLRLDEFFGRLKAHYGLDESIASLTAELNERMLEMIPQKVQPKPGAEALIRHAADQGIPYCIASSSSMAIIKAVVASQGWQELIPHLYSADMVAKGKPAPDIYLFAAEQLNARAANSAAFEDSPNGARAAVAAGMTTYVVPDGHSSRAAFAEITPHVYDSLEHILPLLQGVHKS